MTTDNKAPREFWIRPVSSSSPQVFDHKPNDFRFHIKDVVHVIEKSYADKLQQELEAARAVNLDPSLYLKRQIDAYEEMKKQLADAKAQIADYQAALEHWSQYPEAYGSKRARAALNKWREK